MKVFRLHDCVCCILHFFGHFSPLSGEKDRGYMQVELLCLWRYLLLVFFVKLPHFYKNLGPRQTKHVQLYILFYVKHVIRKFVFSSTSGPIWRRLFSVFLFFKLKLCMNYWTYFSAFLHGKIFWSSSLKVKKYFSFLLPICAFLILPTMFIERTLPVAFCDSIFIWM